MHLMDQDSPQPAQLLKRMCQSNTVLECSQRQLDTDWLILYPEHIMRSQNRSYPWNLTQKKCKSRHSCGWWFTYFACLLWACYSYKCGINIGIIQKNKKNVIGADQLLAVTIVGLSVHAHSCTQIPCSHWHWKLFINQCYGVLWEWEQNGKVETVIKPLLN